MPQQHDLIRLRELFSQHAHHDLCHVLARFSTPIPIPSDLQVLSYAQIGHLTVARGRAYEGDQAIEVRRKNAKSPCRPGVMSVKEALTRAATMHREYRDGFVFANSENYVCGLSGFAGDAGALEQFDLVAGLAIPVISELHNGNRETLAAPRHSNAHALAFLVHQLIRERKNLVLRHVGARLQVADWQMGKPVPDFAVSIYTEAGGDGFVCQRERDDALRNSLERAAAAEHDVMILPCNIFHGAAMVLQLYADDFTRPAVGFLRVEDIRVRHPDLTDAEQENVRNQLQTWRKTHEDDCFAGEVEPSSGRQRWAYPLAKVDEIAESQRRKRQAAQR